MLLLLIHLSPQYYYIAEDWSASNTLLVHSFIFDIFFFKSFLLHSVKITRGTEFLYILKIFCMKVFYSKYLQYILIFVK